MKPTKLASALLASALALAALSAQAFAETTINFLHKWPEPQNMAYFEKAVKEFEATHPDIKIKMEAVADEPYKDKIRVLMASDQVPDVYFSWSGEFGKKFARGGRALDITDTVYGSDWKSVFSEASMGPFKYKDKLYSAAEHYSDSTVPNTCSITRRSSPITASPSPRALPNSSPPARS